VLGRGRVAEGGLVRVAVAVCTCRRSGPLRCCLRAIGAAETDVAAMQVIVVDNAPDDGAGALTDSLRGELGSPLRLVEEPRRGIFFARNRALQEALALGAELVFGRWKPAAGLVLPPGLEAGKLLRKARKPEGALDRFGLPQDASTNNLLLTRGTIERMAAEDRLFSPEFALTGGSDHDFIIRCLRRGLAFARCPDSVVDGFWDGTRLIARGVLRRAFNLSVKQAMLETRHLPPEETAHARRRTLRKLPRISLAALTALVRPQPGRTALSEACDVVTLLGRLSAYGGLRYRYYR
jgi:succinoglycan biosynthesis protein ExoM